MHQFVENVVGVVGDGHCELCGVADICGMSVNDHHVIHIDLIRELTNDSVCQLLVSGIENQFYEVKNALTQN